jgi:hypothetical protein
MRTSRASLALIALSAMLATGMAPAHAVSPYPYIRPAVSGSVTLPPPQVYTPPARTQTRTPPQQPAPYDYGIPGWRATPDYGRLRTRR